MHLLHANLQFVLEVLSKYFLRNLRVPPRPTATSAETIRSLPRSHFLQKDRLACHSFQQFAISPTTFQYLQDFVFRTPLTAPLLHPMSVFQGTSLSRDTSRRLPDMAGRAGEEGRVPEKRDTSLGLLCLEDGASRDTAGAGRMGRCLVSQGVRRREMPMTGTNVETKEELCAPVLA